MRNKIINLLSLFLFMATTLAIVTACDKTDDPGDDFPSAGTVKDADGNVYNTVKIGDQIWTVENLKTTSYNDGTPILNVTDGEEWASLSTGAYCNYDNLESNAEIYGRLYNWYAVNTGKLTPAGWHVPTNDDWTILEEYLTANGYNYDGTNEGNKIAKSMASKTGWQFCDEDGTPGNVPEDNNSTGFTALPGGSRFYNKGIFLPTGYSGIWWSSDVYGGKTAWGHSLNSKYESLSYHSGYKENGFSVRLVKD